MRTPARLRDTGARVVAVLGVYGTLVGLGLLPVPLAIVALLLGAISNDLTPALGIALAISLAANVALATAFWRSPWRRRRHSIRMPRHKAFLVEGDLDTLTTTSSDLEGWWNNAMTVARAKVGHDAQAYVDSIHIAPLPFIVVYGESVAARKRFNLHVGGPHPDHVDWMSTVRSERLEPRTMEEPLWRTDDTWRELLRQSWIRERPVRRGVVLYQRTDVEGRYWEATYSRYLTSDERLVLGRIYRLRNGKLEFRED